jgi:hypothetical protein
VAKYNRAQQKVAQQRIAIKLPVAIEQAEIAQKREMIHLDLLFGGPMIPCVRRVK